MIPSLSHIGSLQSIKDAVGATPAAGKPGQFASLLDNAIQSVEKPGNEANQAVQNLLGGGNEELHNVAAATSAPTWRSNSVCRFAIKSCPPTRRS